MIIVNLLYSLFLIISVILLFVWLRARRRKIFSKISGKLVLLSFLVALVLGGISGIATRSPNDSQTSESSTASSSASSKTGSSSSTDENDVFESLSTKELKEYNSGLVDSLSEEQQWATDGKDKYNTSLYLDSIEYDTARGLLVYVSDDFESLDKNDKNMVARHAQQMANAQIIILGKDVDSESLPSTNIYHNAKKIGHSTMLSNGNNFKWFKA